MSGTMIFILVLIAFVVWHFLPTPARPQPALKFRHEPRARADDPNWQMFIDEHCDSPAETAFLRAIVDRYKLLPENNSLRAPGIKVDFQVKIGRYRLDFLANEWLIIEVDGAAWHSSDEAKARDAARDQFFVELGYSVLRIPARTVFNDPGEAVRRVETALKLGKPIIAKPVQRGGLDRLLQTASSTNKFLADLNAGIDRKRQVSKALKDAEHTFHNEKGALDLAIEAAESRIKVDEMFEHNPAKLASYNDIFEELETLFDEGDKELRSGSLMKKVEIAPFRAPARTGVEEIDAEIEQLFSVMRDERDEYLSAIRDKLRRDKRLQPLVKKTLYDLGCVEIWRYIS